MRIVAGAVSLTILVVACARTAPAPTPAPTPTPVAVAAPGGPAPEGAPRRRVPPNPFQQDTVRRAMVDSVLASIRGREMEPAGRVFRNVTLLKDMPAGEFVRSMDVQYGRALGWTCNNCHVVGKWDDDSRKNKRIARQMQAMQDYINGTALAQVKELDAEYSKASCAMCHRGVAEPEGAYEVQALPPQRPRAGGPPGPPPGGSRP
jgi:hypothetical protein